MDRTHRDSAWVGGYSDYLRDAVGAADATRMRHLPTVRRFIATCSGPGTPDWIARAHLKASGARPSKALGKDLS